jgi:hypothetical protein
LHVVGHLVERSPVVVAIVEGIPLEQACVGNIRRELRGREAWYRLERPARVPDVSLYAEGLSQLALSCSLEWGGTWKRSSQSA